jgi:hypothetical protein
MTMFLNYWKWLVSIRSMEIGDIEIDFVRLFSRCETNSLFPRRLKMNHYDW